MARKNAEKLARKKKELAEVDAAISAILAGSQSYRFGSRSLTRADLAILYKRKDALEELVDALSGAGGRFRRAVPVG